jgi:hypothetical protein
MIRAGELFDGGCQRWATMRHNPGQLSRSMVCPLWKERGILARGTAMRVVMFQKTLRRCRLWEGRLARATSVSAATTVRGRSDTMGPTPTLMTNFRCTCNKRLHWDIWL